MRFPFPAEEIVDQVTAAEAVSSAVEPLGVAPEEVLTPVAPEENPHVSDQSEGAAAALLEEEPDAEQSPVAVDSADLVLEPIPEPEALVDTAPRPRPKRKVIAFPRHLSVAPESVYRLADPVTSEVPRILDVPEELQAIPTTPFLDGLQLDPVKSAIDPRDREHLDLPFRAVRVAQRVFAGVIDAAVTGMGAAIFAGVVYKIIPQLPVTKPLILASVAMAGLLWSAYQYLFLVYGGQTFGMMAAKIRLRTFKGNAPNLRQRRNRVLGFYLSVLSLCMGLMWVLVDVDGLCWHDRLSRTYLSNRE